MANLEIKFTLDGQEIDESVEVADMDVTDTEGWKIKIGEICFELDYLTGRETAFTLDEETGLVTIEFYLEGVDQQSEAPVFTYYTRIQ